MLIVLGVRQMNRDRIYSLGMEPRYDGQSLGYWTDHAFRYYGSQRIANVDATEAMQNMKHDALPFLVKWIATPSHSSHGIDYESRALHGFEILGPAATPAIPELIKLIGRNNNWPASALACIGTAAVPALIELLTTNQTPDFHGNWRRGIPDNLVRENAILTLAYLGTNAQAALPVLMRCYQDEGKRSRADMASALARVGNSQPQIVVPALVYLLTNSSGFQRIEATKALGSFGGQAKLAVPELSQASQSSDAQLQIQAAVALKTIAPERADALAPVILNLTNRESYIREQAFRALEQLGTNAIEARSALLERAWQEKAPDIRVLALNCLKNLAISEEDMLPILRECLTNQNESVTCAAVNGLVALAGESSVRYLELLSAAQKHRNPQVRTIAKSGAYVIMQKNPNLLLECTDNPKPEVYSLAMQFLHGLSHDTLVIDRKEPEPSTNFHAYVMRDFSSGTKRLLQPAIPMLVKRLQDENPEARKLATNILLELDPKAAKQAGVLVVPPYSFYAK
jgi:HEAT repeat protein